MTIPSYRIYLQGASQKKRGTPCRKEFFFSLKRIHCRLMSIDSRLATTLHYFKFLFLLIERRFLLPTKDYRLPTHLLTATL